MGKEKIRGGGGEPAVFSVKRKIIYFYFMCQEIIRNENIPNHDELHNILSVRYHYTVARVLGTTRSSRLVLFIFFVHQNHSYLVLHLPLRNLFPSWPQLFGTAPILYWIGFGRLQTPSTRNSEYIV